MITQEGRGGMAIHYCCIVTHSLEYSNAKQTSPQQIKALAVQRLSFFSKKPFLGNSESNIGKKITVNVRLHPEWSHKYINAYFKRDTV